MARFGSGINPALGAVDYSGFRQGALQGANSAIQGAQMQAQGISQGLSTLGQVVGDVGKQRLEFKTQVKAAEAAAKAVETIPDIDPKIIAFVKQQAEMMKDPNLSLRDQAAIGQQVNQLFSGVVSSGIQTIMQMQERERMAAPISRAFSPGAPLADTSPQGRAAFALSQGADPRMALAARQAVTPDVQTEVDPLDRMIRMAQLEKLQKEAAQIGAPKPIDPVIARKQEAEATLAEANVQKAQREDYLAFQKEVQGAETMAKKLEGEQMRSQNILDQIKRAKNLARSNPALPMTATTGLVGKVSGLVPGTPAYELKQTLGTIKANIGFDRLQQMRAESPTGGALGQVAIQELEALQNSIASLEQGLGGEDLVQNLNTVEKFYNRWLKSAGRDIEKFRQPVQGLKLPAGWSISQ